MVLTDSTTLNEPSDRRIVYDRRRRRTPMISTYTLFGGSRTAGRRACESANIYVDRFPFGMSLLLVGIFFLNVLDAVLTLLHLQRGGEEANPFMAMALSFGPQAFFFIKCGVTAAALLFLLMHVRFHYVRKVLGTVFGVYCCVFCYHMYLNSL